MKKRIARHFVPRVPQWLTAQIKSLAALSQQGFFFVAECDQISNLDLIRDIYRIIKLQEILSLIK